MKQQLKIAATQAGGSSTTKTLSNVNPVATNAVLAQFATKLNALTTNTYTGADRIITINVDTEPDFDVVAKEA